MKVFRWVLVTCLATAGCAVNVQNSQLTNIPLATKPLVPSTESACAASGNFWTEQGIPGGGKSCAVKTTDARKICSDSLQCQGTCLVAASLPVGSKAFGSCSEWVANSGCYKYMDGGRVQEICSD